MNPYKKLWEAVDSDSEAVGLMAIIMLVVLCMATLLVGVVVVGVIAQVAGWWAGVAAAIAVWWFAYRRITRSVRADS